MPVKAGRDVGAKADAEATRPRRISDLEYCAVV